MAVRCTTILDLPDEILLDISSHLNFVGEYPQIHNEAMDENEYEIPHGLAASERDFHSLSLVCTRFGRVFSRVLFRQLWFDFNPQPWWCDGNLDDHPPRVRSGLQAKKDTMRLIGNTIRKYPGLTAATRELFIACEGYCQETASFDESIELGKLMMMFPNLRELRLHAPRRILDGGLTLSFLHTVEVSMCVSQEKLECFFRLPAIKTLRVVSDDVDEDSALWSPSLGARVSTVENLSLTISGQAKYLTTILRWPRTLTALEIHVVSAGDGCNNNDGCLPGRYTPEILGNAIVPFKKTLKRLTLKQAHSCYRNGVLAAHVENEWTPIDLGQFGSLESANLSGLLLFKRFEAPTEVRRFVHHLFPPSLVTLTVSEMRSFHGIHRAQHQAKFQWLLDLARAKKQRLPKLLRIHVAETRRRAMRAWTQPEEVSAVMLSERVGLEVLINAVSGSELG